MYRGFFQWFIGLWLSLVLLSSNISSAIAANSVVHAIIFYSPSCGHCHQVITEVLPPLLEQYNEQFQIIGVNVADPGGQALYQAAIEYFAIPAERRGVPTLVIGETVLVGSLEIPEQLPEWIEVYLAQGGVNWPSIPGLTEALAASASTPTATPIITPAPAVATAAIALPAPTPTSFPNVPGIVAEDTGWRARFARDPLGNSISVAVLLGMVFSIFYHSTTLTHPPSEASQRRWQWAIPPLVVLGLIVAGYLAYVETQQVTAVCGPVGDCNAVQQSKFALLFGYLPVAVLGLVGYVGIGVAWGVARVTRALWAALAQLALVGMAWFGVAFSIYLTFLEPFVIGATCTWCLTSAVVMTLLLWVIAPLTRPALDALRAQ